MRVGHQTEDFKHHGGSDQRRVAGLIIRGSDFNYVAADEVQAAQTSQEPLSFKGGKTADFRCSGARSIHRIESIHVEGNICRPIPHDGASLFDHTLDTERGEFFNEHHSHAVGARELYAVQRILAPPYADLDRAPRV